MADLNRREFVAVTAVAACACAMGASVARGEDRGHKPPTTEPGLTDVGSLTQFAKDGVVDTYAWEKHFYLITSGGKLAAVSSICQHKGCMVEPKDTIFHCPCHGQEYNFDGSIVIEKRTKTGLPIFAIAVDDKGNVTVDSSKIIDPADTKNPAASVSVTKK